MIASKKPRKQRKALFNAPLHKRKKLLKVKLSKELKEKLNKKLSRVLIKKGDKIKIIKGKFKGKTGDVLEVDYKKLRIFVSGISRKNAKGVEKLIPIRPYNVVLIDGDFSSKYRKNLLESKENLKVK
jgi:large subunit ribosomal protein L24